MARASTQGFAETTVADLVETSGVSRRTLYALFGDKADLLRATIESILAGLAIEPSDAESGDGPEQRLRRRFRVFATLARDQPAAARTCLLEAHAGGPETRMPLEAAVGRWWQGIASILAEDRERAGVPDEIVEGLAGASLEIVRDRLEANRTEDLPGLIDEIVDLLLVYRAPPEPLRMHSRIPARSQEILDGGDHRERVVGALAHLCFERGYADLGVDEIIAGAGMSPRTFYANFRGKEDALLAAIESIGAQMSAAALPAFRRHQDWSIGVRAGIGALLNFLAARPALAHLILVEAHTAGAAALARRDDALKGLGAMLAPGWSASSEAIRVAPWAIAMAGYHVGRRTVLDSGPEGLAGMAPVLTFLALAPFLGSRSAGAAANGSRPGFRPAPERLEAIRNLAIQPHKREALSYVSYYEPVGEREIARTIGAPLEVVRRHLAELLAEGLVTEAPPNGAGSETLYRPAMSRIDDAEWAALSLEARERISAEIGTMVAAEIAFSVEAGTFDRAPGRHLSRLMARVDEQGWEALREIHDRALTESLAVRTECADRLGRDDRAGRSVRSVQTLFEMPDF